MACTRSKPASQTKVQRTPARLRIVERTPFVAYVKAVPLGWVSVQPVVVEPTSVFWPGQPSSTPNLNLNTSNCKSVY